MVVLTDAEVARRRAAQARVVAGEVTFATAARELGLPPNTFRAWCDSNRHETAPIAALTALGYNLNVDAKSPQEAWDAHVSVAERRIGTTVSNRWRTIKRPRGPFVIFHSTDEHIDDDATPLRQIEADVKAARAMNAVMCHGGDLLNNWPVAGKLAKMWAEQQCTLPDALLRAQHFVEMFKPDVWADGNHEEMNPYLVNLLRSWLPKGCITEHWTARFVVETPGGRPVRCVLSHKFQKGSSWFHAMHGHIREMLTSEEADILMDGHFHQDGVMEHTIPERGLASLAVASAGYKAVDKFGTRISRGGTIPRLRGRAHWIVADPSAAYDETLAVAFKSARQAEAYLNGLQNLRAA